ncbi:MAG: polyphosphate polymerase domain-containing protein [Clostridia bacterium]|nr:polyphosphate polymerase domain-containing protein [Clostridia bacterium]
MAYQAIFKRYEIKYMLTVEQKNKMVEIMEPYMSIDKYGHTTIRNIYFDTDNYRLIRRSIEKPLYKEKLRIRSYQTATDDSPVFVELKKKYKKVVYKRRISMTEHEAMAWICNGESPPVETQITREIDYFRNFYGNMRPAVFLSYEREAFFSKDKSDFRVTFDDNILCRQTQMSLCEEPYGDRILEEGKVMMEIKCSGGMPLWMAHALTELGLSKTSFSKYGIAYQTLIFPELNNTKEIHSYV